MLTPSDRKLILHALSEEVPMGVHRFRKRPVVIEAIQFGSENVHEIVRWAHASGHPEMNSVIVQDGFGCLYIRTLEGEMLAEPGDWIIKGVKGEFYSCKPDIFEMTYERVPS